MSELPKNYDPKAIEQKWYDWWKEKGYFHSDAERGGKPYTVVIPPPNVTGILHMGHALNESIQDVIYSVTPDGNQILYVSPSAERVYETKLEEGALVDLIKASL